jgi:asparaginyl-tRNA synthetase
MNAVMRIRSTVFNALRSYFHSNGYYETHSPLFVTGACEGGSTLFEVPYFKGMKAYLAQSWQLYAEALVSSLEKIFTIAPSFRAEKSRTRRHLTEYWHCEAEVAWMGNEGIMEVEEELVDHVVRTCLEKHRKDLEYLKRDLKVLDDASLPYDRVKYLEALDILQKKGVGIRQGDDFGYNEEKVLTKEFKKPFFVTHFPKEAKAFYHRPDPRDPGFLLCNDLLAPEGYGEIIGGGERIWEIDEIEQRIKEEGMAPEQYEWYMDLRKYGSVPHSGFGLGIERLIMWICGLDHIKNAIPFPRMTRRAYP